MTWQPISGHAHKEMRLSLLHFFLFQRDGKLYCQADPKLLNSWDPSFLFPMYLEPWACATRPSTFSLKFAYCVYMHEHTRREISGQPLKSALSFHHAGFRDQIQVIRQGGGVGIFTCRAIFPAPHLAFSVQHCTCQIYSCFCLLYV